MSAQTAREAVDNYVHPLQRAFSCIADAVLGNKGGYFPSPKPHVLTFANTDGSTFLADAELKFGFIQHYSIVQLEADQPYKVRTLYYAYSLEDLDSGEEIFAYHWHPEGVSAVRYPHLHLKHGAQIGRPELVSGHLPTGRIAIEDVLTYIIEQFHVRPPRNDWREILEDTGERFRKTRSWA